MFSCIQIVILSFIYSIEITSHETEHLFSKAFKKPLSPPRPPEKEVRLSTPITAVIQNFDDPNLVKSSSQDAEPKNDNTSIYHLSIPTRTTYVSSTDSMKNGTLSRHNSSSSLLTVFSCSPVVSGITCSILVPCSFIQSHLTGFMKMNVPISFTSSPWDLLHSIVMQLTDLRGLPLSENEEWQLEEALCFSLQQALNDIEKQQPDYTTVYSYLNTIKIKKTISLYLPAYYINDDRESDHLIKVKFPITEKNLPFGEFTSTIISSLIHSIDELKRQLSINPLSEEMKKRLSVEITTILSLQVYLYVIYEL